MTRGVKWTLELDHALSVITAHIIQCLEAAGDWCRDEDSPLGLDKWLCAMWQVVNCKNGVSSWEIHRAIGVTQKTAWFMDHRIRLALTMGSIDKLSGEVEADETFIGGTTWLRTSVWRDFLRRFGITIVRSFPPREVIYPESVQSGSR